MKLGISRVQKKQEVILSVGKVEPSSEILLLHLEMDG